ncbi:MAG: molybdopterin-binding protein [Desulfurococcaceae archaeon]
MIKDNTNKEKEKLEFDLLEKTELWIEGIKLRDVDLRKIASVVASVLGLREDEIQVVDVNENIVTLDILRKTIKAKNIVGKEKELLDQLKNIRGVELDQNASVHSDGVLSLISLTKEDADYLLDSLMNIRKNLIEKVEKRVIVFSTGSELKNGLVRDTNYEVIKDILSKKGFVVKFGGILDDDETLIAGAIRKALNEGYGIIITTGGTGAENKDKTIEALIKVDPDSSTPCVINYEKGKGRHVKECVRVGVGYVGSTLIISLPGPTEEVRESLDEFIKALEMGLDKNKLAEAIASRLRRRILEKYQRGT